jgi:hypothetical protein
LTSLLLQESNFIQVILLELTEVLLQVVDVFQDLLEDIVQALRALMLQSGALRSKKLRVFFIIIQLLDALFDIELY